MLFFGIAFDNLGFKKEIDRRNSGPLFQGELTHLKPN